MVAQNLPGPGIPSALGNFVLPLQVGAKDVAFPKVNLLSFYLYVAGAVLFLVTLVVGGLDTGWTLYPPYSLEGSRGLGILIALVGVFLAGFSSILTGVNFIATIHKLRPPDMGWFDLPLFLWALYATAIIQILATPVLGITAALGFMERIFHLGLFMPEYGGDPVLFQHFFWFYSHPAVYIMILPAMGFREPNDVRPRLAARQQSQNARHTRSAHHHCKPQPHPHVHAVREQPERHRAGRQVEHSNPDRPMGNAVVDLVTVPQLPLDCVLQSDAAFRHNGIWDWSRVGWSGRRDSNPRHQPWQGCTLPAELLPREMTPYRLSRTSLRLSNAVTETFRTASTANVRKRSKPLKTRIKNAPSKRLPPSSNPGRLC